MSTSNVNERESYILRWFATWAIVLLMVVSAFLALFLVVQVFYRDPAQYGKFVYDHIRAVVGVPMAAASAFCVVLFLEVRGGPMEFEAMGFSFRGAAAPAVIWIFAFLAFASVIRLLW
jgi:hypothetical protein